MIFKRMITPLLAAFTLSATMLTTAAYADDDENRGKRRGPPPVAIEACANLVEGDACGFTGRRGRDLQGICKVSPKDDTTIACKPERRRKGSRSVE